MKKLWLCVLMMCASVLPAQTAPVRSEDVVASANILSSENRIAFQVRWTQRAQVDSTMIAVFLSNDTLPVVYRRAMSPDTVIFTIPDDTTTYKFLLVNVRRGFSSLPANVNFYFNANNYYKLTRIHVRPDSVVVTDTTDAGRTIQFCAFLEFSDGSIVMRDKDRSIAKCITEYEKFNVTTRKSTGARLRNANSICLEWTAPNGGTITSESCGKP
jgi:hypothetical protein